ncbi:hypothetical protein L596_014196 [Steinernema carpocapsae]|uniref:Uncharacterized protein n=1 Tax=Steinernema carpocapsae TaxID=34508 RepID=A0A4V6XW71_STECR|nr:hypothetical protein L596_014196 [Steinernema carpocapsae]
MNMNAIQQAAAVRAMQRSNSSSNNSINTTSNSSRFLEALTRRASVPLSESSPSSTKPTDSSTMTYSSSLALSEGARSTPAIA